MLKTGNPQQIAQVTFWSTLKSLHVISQIRKNYFKDDPVVSSELVKFLTVNSLGWKWWSNKWGSSRSKLSKKPTRI
jgi:hypothetical protein